MTDQDNSSNFDKTGLMKDLCDKIRIIAKNELINYANIEDITLKEINDNEELVHDHWIVGILMKTQVINVTFRVHFSSRSARALAAAGMGITKEKLNAKLTHDFIKEYCNRAIGSIKRMFLEGGMNPKENVMDTEVPVEEPSFDETNLKKDIHENNIDDAWLFIYAEGDIACETKLMISDWGKAKSLKNLEVATVALDDDGDIDFL